eukprot:scaffold1093_cov190-Pinguiococcus_pyrenoidosus.AAC.1
MAPLVSAADVIYRGARFIEPLAPASFLRYIISVAKKFIECAGDLNVNEVDEGLALLLNPVCEAVAQATEVFGVVNEQIEAVEDLTKQMRAVFPGQIGHSLKRFDGFLDGLSPILASFSFLDDLLDREILKLPAVGVSRYENNIKLGKVCIRIKLGFIRFKKCWSLGSIPVVLYTVQVGGELCIPVTSVYAALYEVVDLVPTRFLGKDPLKIAESHVEKYLKIIAGGKVYVTDKLPKLACLEVFNGDGGISITFRDVLGYLSEAVGLINDFPFIREMIDAVEKTIEDAAENIFSAPAELVPSLELDTTLLDEMKTKADALAAMREDVEAALNRVAEVPLAFLEDFRNQASASIQGLPCDISDLLRWVIGIDDGDAGGAGAAPPGNGTEAGPSRRLLLQSPEEKDWRRFAATISDKDALVSELLSFAKILLRKASEGNNAEDDEDTMDIVETDGGNNAAGTASDESKGDGQGAVSRGQQNAQQEHLSEDDKRQLIEQMPEVKPSIIDLVDPRYMYYQNARAHEQHKVMHRAAFGVRFDFNLVPDMRVLGAQMETPSYFVVTWLSNESPEQVHAGLPVPQHGNQLYCIDEIFPEQLSLSDRLKERFKREDTSSIKENAVKYGWPSQLALDAQIAFYIGDEALGRASKKRASDPDTPPTPGFELQADEQSWVKVLRNHQVPVNTLRYIVVKEANWNIDAQHPSFKNFASPLPDHPHRDRISSAQFGCALSCMSRCATRTQLEGLLDVPSTVEEDLQRRQERYKIISPKQGSGSDIFPFKGHRLAVEFDLQTRVFKAAYTGEKSEPIFYNSATFGMDKFSLPDLVSADAATGASECKQTAQGFQSSGNNDFKKKLIMSTIGPVEAQCRYQICSSANGVFYQVPRELSVVPTRLSGTWWIDENSPTTNGVQAAITAQRNPRQGSYVCSPACEKNEGENRYTYKGKSNTLYSSGWEVEHIIEASHLKDAYMIRNGIVAKRYRHETSYIVNYVMASQHWNKAVTALDGKTPLRPMPYTARHFGYAEKEIVYRSERFECVKALIGNLGSDQRNLPGYSCTEDAFKSAVCEAFFGDRETDVDAIFSAMDTSG